MSVGQESNVDLVAVACVIEASLLLASEWSRILTEYVFPLLRRLNELHPSHQFRIALITYGAADTRPQPLLSRKFFAPLSQIKKDLGEDPSNLGIGQTNSGNGRGLCALEGLVAAIELFDILMTSVNFAINNVPTQSPQKESRSLISHILHIAASPPDNALRPHCNTLQHLDSVNWDSMPTELRKRKINLSLISLRKIPQFQDLQTSVAGSTAQPPWFNVHAPHVLLLAGFPTPQKTSLKRQPDAPLSDQSPDPKRQKLIADSTSKRLSASPALPPARIPIPHPQQPVPPQVAQLPAPALAPAPALPPPPPPSQPTTAAAQNPPSTQLAQTTSSAPVPTPVTSSPVAQLPPSGLPADSLEQVVPGTQFKFGQMKERFKAMEKEIEAVEEKISKALNTGANVAELQKQRASMVLVREQVKTLLRQHYDKMYAAKEVSNPQAGSAASGLPNPTAEAGSSTQPHPPNASSEKPPGPPTEEHKPQLSDSQILAQLWLARGGTISATGGNSSAGSSKSQPQITPEVAAQMQKLIEKQGIRPPTAGPPSQASGAPSQETGVSSTATNNQPAQPHNPVTWSGVFSWPSPRANNGQGTSAGQLQIYVVGIYGPSTPSDVRTDAWPKNLTLNPCKAPLKDGAELQSWLRRHQSMAHIMQFRADPRVPDGPVNEQKFQALKKHMFDNHIFAYAGWQLPSGRFLYNIVIFPMGNNFAAAVFPEGIPDLPGSGNVLDNQTSAAEVKPPTLSGASLPPALVARLHGLEPAKQRALLAQWFRGVQQEQLRRQQLQQNQQVHNASGQALNSLGMSIPPNAYNAVANIPAGLQLNANGPVNAGSYNTASGTVNYEMLQSFMQRNAEGSTSTSQGIHPS